MQGRIEVIGFGALNCDKICQVESVPLPGQEVGVISMMRQPGGSAANTIVGLARLGVKTGFLGTVGDDPEGSQLLQNLRREKVNLQGIERVRGNTGATLIFIDSVGERTIYVLPSVNDSYRTMNYDYARRALILHISSFMGAQQLAMQTEFTQRLQDSKTRISFSPGNFYSKLGLDALTPLIERCFIVFLNSEEALALLGSSGAEDASMLLELGAHMVAITLGDGGCHVATRDESVRVPAYESSVHDTIGAGDAFAAGFLYGQLRGANAYRSGLCGNYLASRSITALGARKGLPREETASPCTSTIDDLKSAR